MPLADLSGRGHKNGVSNIAGVSLGAVIMVMLFNLKPSKVAANGNSLIDNQFTRAECLNSKKGYHWPNSIVVNISSTGQTRPWACDWPAVCFPRPISHAMTFTMTCTSRWILPWANDEILTSIRSNFPRHLSCLVCFLRRSPQNVALLHVHVYLKWIGVLKLNWSYWNSIPTILTRVIGIFIPPLKKAGHIALHMSVGKSVGLYVSTP